MVSYSERRTQITNIWKQQAKESMWTYNVWVNWTMMDVTEETTLWFIHFS